MTDLSALWLPGWEVEEKNMGGGGGGQWYILYLWYLWEGSGTSFTHSVLFIRHHHDTYTGACWESCMWLPVFTPLALW